MGLLTRCRVFFAFACALSAGCGDESVAGPDAAADAATDAVPLDAAQCNAVVNRATLVDTVAMAVAAPTPQGGPIVDGTYVVSASTVYTGVGGQTGSTGVVYQATSVNSAGTYQFVDQGGGSVQRSRGTFVVSGNDINITQTCPDPTSLTYTKLDASATAFTIYDVTNPALVGALTFTKL